MIGFTVLHVLTFLCSVMLASLYALSGVELFLWLAAHCVMCQVIALPFLEWLSARIRDSVNATFVDYHKEVFNYYRSVIHTPYFALRSVVYKRYIWSCYIHHIRLANNYISNVENRYFREYLQEQLLH